MATYRSGETTVRIEQIEPAASDTQPALILLHGSGGAVGYWAARFGPALAALGIGLYAPHYFDKTGTGRATAEMILDGRHFPAWLTAIEDAVAYAATRPSVDPKRIAVLGVSLGGYLAVALATQNPTVRAAIELSGGLPPGWEHQLRSSMPPILILHGADDTVVPVTEAYKLERLLTEKGAPHEIEIFAGETHWFSQAAQPRLLMRCASFLSGLL